MANGLEARARGATGHGGHDAARLGSRRIFAPQFKLQVLDSYRNDSDCRGNQRATARKYGIHRRQIQKWLQAEAALRGAARPASPPAGPVDLSVRRPSTPAPPCTATEPAGLAWDLSLRAPQKIGYEPEAPPPPRSFRLFRPYLPGDNFEEVELVEPQFRRVAPQIGATVPAPPPPSSCALEWRPPRWLHPERRPRARAPHPYPVT